MFVSSVVLYLLLRKSQLMGIGNIYNNLAMFALPAVGYAILGGVQQVSFLLPWWQIGLLILSAIFFSYFGNKASLRSVQLSPNPGFSLMISKSYVVATTLAAVILFGSELTWKGILAIGLILFFAFQIGVDYKSGNQKLRVGRWFIYSLGAFFAWAGLALISTYFIRLGVSLPARLFYICLVVSLIIGFEMWWKKPSSTWKAVSG